MHLLRRTYGQVGSRLDCTNCSKFISKDAWAPNSSDVNLPDYHVWRVMLEQYMTFHLKPKKHWFTEVKRVLQLIWNQMPQDPVNKPKKTSSLSENVLQVKLFKTRHWTFNITSDFNFWLILKYRMEYCKSYNFKAVKTFWWLSRTIENVPCKYCNICKKSPSVVIFEHPGHWKLISMIINTL